MIYLIIIYIIGIFPAWGILSLLEMGEGNLIHSFVFSLVWPLIFFLLLILFLVGHLAVFIEGRFKQK